MAEQQEPAKKIAKRVVKKTIVRRPVRDQSAPPMRYGRPAPKATVQRPKAAAAPIKPKTKAKAAPASKPVAKPRPSRQIGKKAGVASKAVAGGVKGVAGSVGMAGGSAFQRVRGVRFPRVPQIRASALVGMTVGLVAVSVAVMFSILFTELRGTSSGGGRWGSLTFVVTMFIAFALGEFLLAKLHVRQPRVTSLLAICLMLVAILAFFLDPIAGAWAWLIVPLLGAAAYALAHRLIHWADSSRAQPE